MTKNQIIHCEESIGKWNKTPSGIEKNRLRNELFIFMKPFMERWVFSILSKHGKFLDEGNANSHIWECFQFCLLHFKPNQKIPLPNHFYAYSKFWLASESQKERKEKKKNQESSGTARGINESFSGNETNIDCVGDKIDDPFIVYGHIEELKFFRDILPIEYGLIFDDAIMSMMPGNRQRVQRLDAVSLPYGHYHVAKRIFKIVIRYLLTR